VGALAFPGALAYWPEAQRSRLQSAFFHHPSVPQPAIRAALRAAVPRGRLKSPKISLQPAESGSTLLGRNYIRFN
jgi:hypothetical protein